MSFAFSIQKRKKSMQKIHLFECAKTAKNYGNNFSKLALFFILTLIIQPSEVDAAGRCTECADCYRCVNYQGCNCVECVYDKNFCQQGECVIISCPPGEKWNSETCKCEGGIVIVGCDKGYYIKPGFPSSCEPCPQHVTCPFATSTEGNMGGIESCFIPGGTSCSDDTGDYTFIQNCNHTP